MNRYADGFFPGWMLSGSEEPAGNSQEGIPGPLYALIELSIGSGTDGEISSYTLAVFMLPLFNICILSMMPFIVAQFSDQVQLLLSDMMTCDSRSTDKESLVEIAMLSESYQQVKVLFNYTANVLEHLHIFMILAYLESP